MRKLSYKKDKDKERIQKIVKENFSSFLWLSKIKEQYHS